MQGSVLVRASLQYLSQQIELAGAEFTGVLIVVPVAEEFPAQLQSDAGQQAFGMQLAGESRCGDFFREALQGALQVQALQVQHVLVGMAIPVPVIGRQGAEVRRIE
ncbi:hypothetical protein D9M70_89830 [compost metagenome]